MRTNGIRAIKQPYLFVDTVRFWSMFAVVGMHCLSVYLILGDPTRRVWMVLDSPLKFGTIGFFLISGFLLGDKLQTCRPTEYVLRRLQRVFVPWVFWYLMLAGYYVASMYRETHTAFHFDAAGGVAVRLALFNALFGSPMWFVPNLLLGMCLLLLFRRYLHSAALGLGLLVPCMFYAVNIYFVWVPSQHTEALLGFVFYLWLGSYVAHRKDAFLRWLDQVPAGVLAGWMIVAGVLAGVECKALIRLDSSDPMNTLRISNQVFSVLAVLLLVKLRRRSWPSFVHVRQEIFGVYLTHTIAIALVIRATRYSLRGAPGSWLVRSSWGLGILWLVTIAVVWVVCLGVTKALARWRATRWVVGAVPEETASARRKAVMAA